MLYALIWPFDFSFSGFCVVGWLFLWFISCSIAQTTKQIGNMTKSALKNEFVQEAGKSAVEAWLESVFKK